MITMSGIFPDIDLRIRPMLEGCFTALYALLTNLRRALKDKARSSLSYGTGIVQAFPRLVDERPS